MPNRMQRIRLCKWDLNVWPWQIYTPGSYSRKKNVEKAHFHQILKEPKHVRCAPTNTPNNSIASASKILNYSLRHAVHIKTGSKWERKRSCGGCAWVGRLGGGEVIVGKQSWSLELTAEASGFMRPAACTAPPQATAGETTSKASAVWPITAHSQRREGAMEGAVGQWQKKEWEGVLCVWHGLGQTTSAVDSVLDWKLVLVCGHWQQHWPCLTLEIAYISGPK